MHGGHSLTGAAVGTFKTGRYSKYLPARLNERYHQAESDPELLSLASEAALVDTRIAELLGRLDTQETSATWVALGVAFDRFKDAQAAADPLESAIQLARIGEFISKGSTDTLAWAELQGLLETRRKLVESERKRYVEMGQVATLDQVYTLIGAIAGLVREHVHDRDALRAISAGLARLTGPTPGRSVGARVDAAEAED